MWAVCRGDCWRCPPSGYSAEVARPERLRTAENRRLVAEIRVIHATSRRTSGSPWGHATLQAQAQLIGVPRWLGVGVSCRAKYAQQEVCRGCTQPSVGRHHHVRLDHQGLARSGGGAGSLRASSHGVGDGEPPDSGVGDGCAHHGRDPPTPGVRWGESCGPWGPVRRHPISGVLAAYGLTASRSRRGNCGDNAVVERFFHTRNTCSLSAIGPVKKPGRTCSTGLTSCIPESTDMRRSTTAPRRSSKR